MKKPRIITFDPGTYAFHGAMRFKCIKGSCFLNYHYIDSSFGKNYSVFAPNYALPLEIASERPCTLEIQSFKVDDLPSFAQPNFLFSSNPSLEQKDELVWFSKTLQGPSCPKKYRRNFEKLLHQFIQSRGKLFLAGGKGAGKSTFSRIITNKLLNHFSALIYIDLDPGQPEISIPCCVSYSILTEPLFQTPEYNHTINCKKFYVGSNAINESFEELYFSAVEKLIKSIELDFPGPLKPHILINSFGYLTDKGFLYHQRLLSILEPNYIIELQRNGCVFTQNLFPDEKSIRITIDTKTPIQDQQPLTLRSLRVFNYFSQGLDVGKTIYSQESKNLSIKGLEICFSLPKKNIPTSIFEALNAQIIYLFNDPRNNNNTEECFYLELEDIDSFEVEGMAIVRGIKDNSLLLVTPLTRDDLNKVNAIGLANSFLTPDLYNQAKRSIIPYIN